LFGFLTGNPPDPDHPGRTIWLQLFHDPDEGWGAREIQFMLFDLGFYCHHLTSAMDAETNRAVRAFKRHAGLGDNAVVDDAFLERLVGDYLAHDGAAVPADRFVSPRGLLGCGERHPVDLRGGTPFLGPSERDRRVDLLVFPQPPRPAPTSATDCSSYPSWTTPCGPRWLEFVGPRRGVADPADAEEILATLEVANWQNAFDYDPPDANGRRFPTGDRPRADFIDRDPDRFVVGLTDLDRRGAGTVRARVKTVDGAGKDVDPGAEHELTEEPNDPGTFRSNTLLLVADEIDNGEINNGSAPGAVPFRARGIANGALNDPLIRAEIGGHVVVDYGGAELGRVPVCGPGPGCVRTVQVSVLILRKTDGTAVTTEADVRERVHRMQQVYQQACIRFQVTIRTVDLAEMPAGVILSNVSGLQVDANSQTRATLTVEERTLLESPLNARSASHPGGARADVVQVFYVNRLDGAAARGISRPRFKFAPDPNPVEDIVNTLTVAADNDESFTLPHEMLHILGDSGHTPAFATFSTNLLAPAAARPNFTDTTVTSRKRILEEQVERILDNRSRVIPEEP
ncbi:MAG TPA: peptidoglycan-binding domain-containing protein, partial [Actinomycetes bacterium]